MILKLMKYEIKSTYKVFFTIMASFILLTMLLCISMNNPSTLMISILSLACFVIAGSTFCIYFVTLFNRYYKNLYEREGYLMLTLPVKGWQLVCSKFAIAMFWSIILGITIAVCMVGVMQFMWFTATAEGMIKEHYTLFSLFKEKIFENGYWYLGFQIVLCILVGIAQTIARIYFVISVAYLPFIKKGHIPIALFLYFLIDMVENFIVSNMMRVVFHYYHTGGFFDELIYLINSIGLSLSDTHSIKFYSIILFSCVITALILAGSSYIISKKASLK